MGSRSRTAWTLIMVAACGARSELDGALNPAFDGSGDSPSPDAHVDAAGDAAVDATFDAPADVTAPDVTSGCVLDAAIDAPVLALDAGVLAISVGGLSTCAWLADHSAVCWGDNHHGELGRGTP